MVIFLVIQPQNLLAQVRVSSVYLGYFFTYCFVFTEREFRGKNPKGNNNNKTSGAQLLSALWAQWLPSFVNGRCLEPPGLPRAGQTALVREVTKNPMATLTELQCCSLKSNTAGCPFVCFFSEGLQHFRIRPCRVTAWLKFSKGTWRALRPWETKFSGQMKQRLNSLGWMPSVMFRGN